MSDEQTIKLKLKTAHVEIEFEGSEGFLRSDLLSFITEVAEIHKEKSPDPAVGGRVNLNTANVSELTTASKQINLSVKTIATKLNVATGLDLALTACAYLALVKKQDTFSGKDILDAMKSAATFYKRSYRINLGSYLVELIKDKKILRPANDVYALHAQVRSELEPKLSN